ncbi:30S ribosomal protein S2 [Nanoarchaeota archaeon]
MAEQKELLVPIDVYLKAGIHIGTKFKTKYMDNFIYKARPDGLFVLNLQKIDERLKLAAKFLANYSPEEILVAGRRENAWKPIAMFAKAIGCKAFPGRYPPGVMTNPALKNFIETKVLLVADAWPDRNAVNDAFVSGIPVVSLCDTNNQSNNIDLVVPCNNKGKKSLGLVFWVLAKEYLKAKGTISKDEEMEYNLEDFVDEM